jgi:hypothetical protein
MLGTSPLMQFGLEQNDRYSKTDSASTLKDIRGQYLAVKATPSPVPYFSLLLSVCVQRWGKFPRIKI